MADYAHAKTDKMIEELEKKIRREFNTAQKETAKKMTSYLKEIDAQKKVQEKLLKAGKITQKEFDDWVIRKTAMGKRWEELRDNLAQDMTNANVIARSIADGYKPDVYALNHNFALYQVESGGKCSTVYQLYDRSTVERLMRENKKLMPPPGKRVKAGIANGTLKRWNNKKLQSVLTQSILQGESIPDAADRIAKAMAVANYKDSVRYARTMMTGAENAGRNDGYNWAAEHGVHLKKEWIATLDDRTRASHAALHGERVATDEKFSNDLEYPGDPSGDDAEVWNCRCTMKVQIEGFETDTVTSSPKMGEMTFEEWQQSRGVQPKGPEPVTPYHSAKLEAAMGSKEFAAFAAKVEESDARPLYDKYADQVRTVEIKRNAGAYFNGMDLLEADYSRAPGTDRHSTIGHEFGHAFDYKAGAEVPPGLHFSELGAIRGGFGGTGAVGDRLFPMRLSGSDEFMEALGKDMAALAPKVKDGSIRTLFLVDVETRNATGGIQDALDGFFGTQDKGVLPWGHGDRYYNKWYNERIKGFGVEKKVKQMLEDAGRAVKSQADVKRLVRRQRAGCEAWANACSALAVGGKELEVMEAYMPETMKAVRMIIKLVEGGT